MSAAQEQHLGGNECPESSIAGVSNLGTSPIAFISNAWEHLPDHIQKTILILVDASLPQDNFTQENKE